MIKCTDTDTKIEWVHPSVFPILPNGGVDLIVANLDDGR